MLKIAICDDQAAEAAIVAAYTKDFIERNVVDAEIRQFSHADQLLTVCQKENFQIYILDIVMPLINGIEVGCEIRRLDREAQIIYATSDPSFALQAFMVNPISYLVKPIDRQPLFDALSLCISKVSCSEELPITVKTREGLCVLPLSSVICCEYTNHVVIYELIGGRQITSVVTRHPFSFFVESLLRDRHFLQTHAAFVLNMRYVEKFTRKGFLMRGEVAVPIAKTLYQGVCKTYMDYIMDRLRMRLCCFKGRRRWCCPGRRFIAKIQRSIY